MSRAILIVAAMCALAVVAGALGGPSDTDAMRAGALDLQDAMVAARATSHGGQP